MTVLLGGLNKEFDEVNDLDIGYLLSRSAELGSSLLMVRINPKVRPDQTSSPTKKPETVRPIRCQDHKWSGPLEALVGVP